MWLKSIKISQPHLNVVSRDITWLCGGGGPSCFAAILLHGLVIVQGSDIVAQKKKHIPLQGRCLFLRLWSLLDGLLHDVAVVEMGQVVINKDVASVLYRPRWKKGTYVAGMGWHMLFLGCIRQSDKQNKQQQKWDNWEGEEEFHAMYQQFSTKLISVFTPF